MTVPLCECLLNHVGTPFSETAGVQAGRAFQYPGSQSRWVSSRNPKSPHSQLWNISMRHEHGRASCPQDGQSLKEEWSPRETIAMLAS